jgi:hypothetical protein
MHTFESTDINEVRRCRIAQLIIDREPAVSLRDAGCSGRWGRESDDLYGPLAIPAELVRRRRGLAISTALSDGDPACVHALAVQKVAVQLKSRSQTTYRCFVPFFSFAR